MAQINLKKVISVPSYIRTLCDFVNSVVTRRTFAVVRNVFGCDVTATIKLAIFDNLVCAE